MSIGTSTVEEYFKELKSSDLENTLEGQLRELGLPAPTRQYQFHNGRRWRFDFAFPELLIAVEVEGGIYAQGDASKGHGGGAAYERNANKYNQAVLDGWKVLRGGPNMVRDGILAMFVAELVRKEMGE